MAIYLGAGALNQQLADRQNVIKEAAAGRMYGAERVRQDFVGLGESAINLIKNYGVPEWMGGAGKGMQDAALAKTGYDVRRQGESDKRDERQVVMYEQRNKIDNLIKAITVDNKDRENAYYKGSTFKALKEYYDEQVSDANNVRAIQEPGEFIINHQILYSDDILKKRKDILDGLEEGEAPSPEERVKLQELAAQMMKPQDFFEKNQLVDKSKKLIQSPFVPVLRNYLSEVLGTPIKDPMTSLVSNQKPVVSPEEIGGDSAGAGAVEDVFGTDQGLGESTDTSGGTAGGSVITPPINIPETIPISLSGTSGEASTALENVVVERLKQDEDALAEKVQNDKLRQSYINAGEMGANFESVVQEIKGYDVGELKEAITLQETKLARAKYNKIGEPEQAMIKQTIAYLKYKLNPKKPQGVVAGEPPPGSDYIGSPEWLQQGYELEQGKWTAGVSTEKPPATSPVQKYTGSTDAGYSGQLERKYAELEALDSQQKHPVAKSEARRVILKDISDLKDKLKVAHELGGPDTMAVSGNKWDSDLYVGEYQSPLMKRLKKELIHTENMIQRNHNQMKQIDAQLAELNRHPSTTSGFKNNVASLTKKRTTHIKQLNDWQTNHARLVKDFNKANAQYEINVGDSGVARNSMIDKTLELEGNGQAKSATAGGFGYPYKDGEYYALAGGLHVAQHMKLRSKEAKEKLAKDVYGSATTDQAKAFLNYLEMSLDQLRDGKFKDDPNLRLTTSQRRVLTEFMWDESIEKMVKGNSFLTKRQGDTTLSKDIPPKLRHMMSDMAFRHGGGWLSTQGYFGFRVLLKKFLAASPKNKSQARKDLVSSFETTDRYEDEIVGKGRVRQSFLHGLLSDMRI